MKECKKCASLKPHEDFYLQKIRGKYMRQVVCKRCRLGEMRLRYQADPSKNLERAKRRYRKNKSDLKQYAKNHYQQNQRAYVANARKYKASKRMRTPGWSDIEAIKQFYIDAPKGMHVDHIIPLNGKAVSGLHVLENLQYLTPEENLVKRNTYAA